METPPSSEPRDDIPPLEEDPDAFSRVEDILKYNLARQQEFEKPVIPEQRKRRKLRDYLVCMVVVNSLLILPNVFLGTNVVVMVYSFAGIVIFSSGFTWVMWKVIGDY